MGQLNLALLGSPEIRHNGQIVIFRTRKALALLSYLAANGGMHSREKLTALFWPESEEESSRATLRSTLVYMRKALGEMSDPTSPHLLVEHDAIGFNFSSTFELDLNTLQAAWQVTRVSPEIAHRQEQKDESELAALQQAVNIYRGDFLAGFSLNDAPDFDEWIGAQRAYWHRRMDAIYHRLSRVQSERGEINEAIETSTRWIAHDSFNEPAYRRLMQAYFAAGDRTAALRTYETCRDMLAKEFKARPAPETEALAERMRVKDLPRRKLLSVSNEQAPLLMAVDPPLIGRENQHSTLVTLYHTVRTAGPRVVTLLGEAGIGKTRLAKTFLDWVAAQGADVLQGRAFEAGGRLPYQPLVEALRDRLARENAPGDLLTSPWLAELSLLLPELREYALDLPLPSPDEAIARPRLFESVARLSHALARRAPLVLFIDDLQWADASSLDLLHYISRSFAQGNMPILLILNVRSEALAIMPELADWLASLERDLPLTRLELNALTPEETVQLIRSLADDEPGEQGKRSESERFGHWLYAETGGQPFFLMETLKTLVERGILAVHTAKDGVPPGIDITSALQHEHLARGILPPGVREVIRGRLARLPSQALTLLTAGAVLGGTFSFERLCQVASIHENEGLSALEALLTSRLLSEIGNEESFSREESFLFTHDKIRDVVYTEAGSTRRRLFHRRALETLQATLVSPAELAHHALAAGMADAALRWSIAAGDEAMRLFAVRDAIVQYEQARRLAAQSAGDSSRPASAGAALTPSDLSHLFLQLGWAYELQSSFAQASSIYEEMLRLARESREPVMECAALNRLATVTARNKQDFAGVEELLKQALIVAESSGNTAGVAETAWNLAQTGFYAGKIAISLPYAERALTLARELDLPEFIARSLHTLATLEFALGKWEESRPHSEEARTRYVALGNREMEAGCLCKLAEIKINAGHPQEGVDAARAALAISQEIEDPWGQINAAIQMAPGLLDQGAYAEALAAIQQGVALARAVQIAPLLIIALAELGNVSRAMLALGAARAAHSEALARCETSRLNAFVPRITGELCADYALASEWQEACTCALKALAARDDRTMYGGLARHHEIEALLWGGKIEQAREEVHRFEERTFKKQRYRIPCLRALAVLARWDQKIDQATVHLEAARDLARQLDIPGERWQIQASLGELYQLRMDTRQSEQAYTEAARIIQSLADSMEDEQQRTAFLSAQHVRAVLEHDIVPFSGS